MQRKRKVKDDTEALGPAAGRVELPFSERREVAAEMKFEQVMEIGSPIWDLLSQSHLLNSQVEVSKEKPEVRGRSWRKT